MWRLVTYTLAYWGADLNYYCKKFYSVKVLEASERSTRIKWKENKVWVNKKIGKDNKWRNDIRSSGIYP
jgi:hypothetical protein